MMSQPKKELQVEEEMSANGDRQINKNSHADGMHRSDEREIAAGIAMGQLSLHDKMTTRLLAMDDAQLSGVPMIPDKFLNTRTFCRFHDFYDGDTATIVFLYEENGALEWVSSRFRFFGYDSPEIKVPKKIVGEERAKAKKAALDAKKFIIDFVQDKLLIVHFTKKEKFGRLMGEVYYFPAGEAGHVADYDCSDKNSISALMIENGHGYEYHGGKKQGISVKE